jgi:hypothetical protein
MEVVEEEEEEGSEELEVGGVACSVVPENSSYIYNKRGKKSSQK